METMTKAIIWYVAFVFSTTLHEAAHAFAALKGGDATAYEGGQVTIDPTPHIRRSPFGMVVIPLLSLIVMGWPLGFASAPYDPFWAQRFPKRAALMSLAGPAANLSLVILAGVCVWIGIGSGVFEAPKSANLDHIVLMSQGGLWTGLGTFLSILFSLNIILFLFNMLPLPPLDGSDVLPLFLSEEVGARVQAVLSNPAFSMIGILIAWRVFAPIVRPAFIMALNLLYPGSSYH